MTPLTEPEIRDAFVNATKRERGNAQLPDLDDVRWDRLEYLGWRDKKAPLAAYVVIPLEDGPVAVILRATERASGARRRAMCAWCEDVVKTADVTMYVARRGGSAGRKGDSIGTMICTDFSCSTNVRRRPTSAEAGSNIEAARAQILATRRQGLIERSAAFVTEIRRTV